MMKIRLLLFYVGIVILSVGCDEKEPDDQVVLPTGLDFTTDVATDGSGKVKVTATADKALFYNVFFGENDAAIRTDDGIAEYTYKASGTYEIKVLAHSGITTYISKTKSVDVDVAPEGTGYSTPLSYDGMDLVWNDEFNGTSLNESDWSYEIGRGGNGWGNNELQYYRKENTNVSNGFLTITAKKESFGGAEYTSSRLITKGKEKFQYGRIDIRAKLPKGKGIWPALWMLGENISSVGWPASGEIDIMELIGGNPGDKQVYGTLHWDDNGHVCTCQNGPYTLSSGIFNDKFHVFSLIWNETKMTWYVDDVKFREIDITPDHMTEFHKEFFFIVNLAVGGNWPGNPDASTTFPQFIVVDYIRVFQNQ